MLKVDSTARIHPTAVVEDGAEIGAETIIGPYSVIGPNVRLGKSNVIKSHVVIEGNTIFGDSNTVYQFASIGADPQDLKYHGEESELKIGNGNTIREYVTIQPGTENGGMLTSVADNNLFMGSVHVGHDTHIGTENIFANGVALAGHVVIEDQAIIGGLAGIHQFATIGTLAMVAAGSMVSQDVPPFVIAQGDRACAVGINLIGLKRKGYKSSDVSEIKGIYKCLFHDEGRQEEKLLKITEEYPESKHAERYIEFVSRSERGLVSSARDRD